MPLDSNLSFTNILKFETPTQIFQRLLHKEVGSEENFMSNLNFFGTPNDGSRIMTDEKHKSLSFHHDVINNPDESCNSTDSDLSVGQEKVDDEKSNYDQTETETFENHPKRNAIGDEEEDNSSNASSSQYTNSSTLLCNPQKAKDISAENSIQMSILRPNPSRIQEEIFRNSQLYAEELVRQQLAAAARLQSISASKIFPHIDPSAFSDKQRMVVTSNPDEIPEPALPSKLNFQSTVFNQKTNDNNQNGNNLFCNNKSAINFQNIHSHLSAISQITNNLSSNIKKDDSTSLSSLSRESSQSPSNFQNLKQHHQNMIFHTHQNQLHERNLKFSIDNILKADFGRRITEPLLRTSKSRKSVRDGKQDKEIFKKLNAPASSMDSLTSRDDNPRVSESFTTNQSATSTDQSKNESNNGSSSGSGSGTVWPAWVSKVNLSKLQIYLLLSFHTKVFCTRYSDRPSSGKYAIPSKKFVNHLQYRYSYVLISVGEKQKRYLLKTDGFLSKKNLHSQLSKFVKKRKKNKSDFNR